VTSGRTQTIVCRCGGPDPRILAMEDELIDEG
jgi:hypothetical protein